MRINTKISIALHLLVLLDVSKDAKLTSEHLAERVGCNAVIVRKMLGNLKKAGLVEVRRGSGGASLCVAPASVSIWDVYQALDMGSLNELIGIHPNPTERGPAGSRVSDLLEKPYTRIAQSIHEAMSDYSLEQIIEDYHAQKNNEHA